MRKYHVNLASLMRVYETNYAKLVALLPKNEKIGAVLSYQVCLQQYQIKIIEVTVYTTLVEVYQIDEQPIYPLPRLTVRLYHDARVAEVCASQQFSYIKAKYDYPNKKMLQKDEKHQLNQFLSDWLTFCLKNGISQEPIFLEKN
ncbi:DUF1249 family protein [Aliivibrio wodanis]|uniref:Dehydrogenase n=1 Tax=Aliivibrio wodanis TaxID=80852 RepID=A0A090KFR4_9GAMM|nr:putative uncharacterized protein [Aliivibrio wodanis]VVV03042.1 hypothetical protein AW0309160_00381 [Aliivibrio wodanis]